MEVEILAESTTSATAGAAMTNGAAIGVTGSDAILPVSAPAQRVIGEPLTADLEALKLQVASAIAQRQYTDIIPLLETVIQKQQELLGETHQEVANTICDLAGWHRLLGDYSKAHKLLSQALELKERTLGPEHPSVAAILTHLALLHTDQGGYDLAEALFKQVLAIDKQLFTANHPVVATDLHRYAVLLRTTGRHEEAHQINGQANAIRAKLNEKPLV